MKDTCLLPTMRAVFDDSFLVLPLWCLFFPWNSDDDLWSEFVLVVVVYPYPLKRLSKF